MNLLFDFCLLVQIYRLGSGGGLLKSLELSLKRLVSTARVEAYSSDLALKSH